MQDKGVSFCQCGLNNASGTDRPLGRLIQIEHVQPKENCSSLDFQFTLQRCSKGWLSSKQSSQPSDGIQEQMPRSFHFHVLACCQGVFTNLYELHQYAC